jgi:uncharacterized protein (DUF3084 family)
MTINFFIGTVIGIFFGLGIMFIFKGVGGESHASNEEISKDLAENKQSLEKLEKEKEGLILAKNTADENYRKAEEGNHCLMEKEKALQDELTKSQVHIEGLENICEDFKIKIENMGEEIEKLKESKLQL